MLSKLRKYALHKLIKSHWMQIGEFNQYPARETPLHKLSHQHKDQEELLLKFAIVTPSFNQADFIQETIAAVLDQKYPNMNYAVIDGGSSDGTVPIIEKHTDQISYWVSEPDEGQADAINKGFANIDGDIMAYINSDDVYTPGTFHYINRYFQQNPDVDAVYGNRIIINADGMETARWVLPSHENEVLRWVDYVPQETLFWRKQIWDAAGGIDTSYQFAMDWDLLLRFQNCGARIVHLPHYFACFRVHSQQKTSREIQTRGESEMNRLRSKEFGRQVQPNEIRDVNDRARFKAWLASIKMHYRLL